jgi:hypothetical protein
LSEEVMLGCGNCGKVFLLYEAGLKRENNP